MGIIFWGVILRFMLRFGLSLRLSRTEVRFDPHQKPKALPKTQSHAPNTKKSHSDDVRFFCGQIKSFEIFRFEFLLRLSRT
ncbi:MAG: hypothetical protein R3Y46_06125 [Opitutales bacterium]